uniref:DUF5641 domain-containing protein n=1 Tax=Anopheles dirus TaxID=7168 RepID=A0A182NQ36_9DIPT
MQQVPDVDLRSIPDNRLNHWRLHARSKWRGRATHIEPNMMVIIRDDNVPPNKWLLGRITETHPGRDGIVRVVTVKTANSDKVKRPVAKLCLLPIEENTTKGT